MKLRDEETGDLYEITNKHIGWDGYLINEDQSNWHPHHDLIVSWARGAEIEFFHKELKVWKYCKPAWNVGDQYRIKPDNSETIAKLEGKHAALLDQLEEVEAELVKLRGNL